MKINWAEAGFWLINSGDGEDGQKTRQPVYTALIYLLIFKCQRVGFCFFLCSCTSELKQVKMLKRTCSLLLLRKSFFFLSFPSLLNFYGDWKKKLLQMCHVYVYVCINWTISFYVFWFFMFMSSVEFKPGVNLTSIFVVLVIFFKVWSSRRNKLAPFCL